MIELVNALYNLGITGNISVKPISLNRYEVRVDGECFGIWDDKRNTFVD